MKKTKWCSTTEEYIQSLKSDIARQGPMYERLEALFVLAKYDVFSEEAIRTLKQLKAKNSFQIALLHQLKDLTK